MKYWELTSAFRAFDKQLTEVLESDRWADPYGKWYRDLSMIIQNQERSKLDAEIPDELLFEVAASVGDLFPFYLNKGWLHTRASSLTDTKLNALQVAEMYGGSVIEEVMEYGSCQVE